MSPRSAYSKMKTTRVQWRDPSPKNPSPPPLWWLTVVTAGKKCIFSREHNQNFPPKLPNFPPLFFEMYVFFIVEVVIPSKCQHFTGTSFLSSLLFPGMTCIWCSFHWYLQGVSTRVNRWRGQRYTLGSRWLFPLVGVQGAEPLGGIKWQSLLNLGGTQIWVGQGCAAQASKPIPIFKGNFGQKRYPFLRIFLQK